MADTLSPSEAQRIIGHMHLTDEEGRHYITSGVLAVSLGYEAVRVAEGAARKGEAAGFAQSAAYQGMKEADGKIRHYFDLQTLADIAGVKLEEYEQCWRSLDAIPDIPSGGKGRG